MVFFFFFLFFSERSNIIYWWKFSCKVSLSFLLICSIKDVLISLPKESSKMADSWINILFLYESHSINTNLFVENLRQPPWDTVIGKAFIIHYTYGCDYDLQVSIKHGFFSFLVKVWNSLFPEENSLNWLQFYKYKPFLLLFIWLLIFVNFF